jgi:YVTN family beta-propeller protein
MKRAPLLPVLLALAGCLHAFADTPVAVKLPSGFSITPLAAPGATLQRLKTGLRPDGSADANGANTAILSPDGSALLVLTSGFNTYFYNEKAQPLLHRVLDPETAQPSTVTTQNAEWIFIFDVRGQTPVLKQRLPLPDTYHGAVWAPDGKHFYISAGIDDRVYVYATTGTAASAEDAYAPDAPFILLGHNAGQRLPLPGYNGGMFHTTPIGQSGALINDVGGNTSAVTAGLALSRDGKTLAAVNMQSDSVSLIDTAHRSVSQEVRFFVPGQAAAMGELPYWAAVRSGPGGGFARAYVTSQRDGQVLSVGPDGTFNIIAVGGEPNRMVLSADQSRLYVANGDLDEIEIIDTASDTVLRRISLLRPGDRLLGAGPSGLTLAPDGNTLYVTLDNENALAVVDVRAGAVTGRIPTGWFPADVAVSADGTRLFVVNAKGPSGASNYSIYYHQNDNQKLPPDGYDGYVLAIEKASLLSFPVPDAPTLATLSAQVDKNDNFANRVTDPMMAFLHQHIHHVIYILRENRTYDQVLGDMKRGNGDAAYCEFPWANTPNNHELATRFVLLDNFYSAGDVSGDGWNWMFQGHANTYTDRTVPVSYGNAGSAFPFDWNGNPRNIGVALPDHAPGPQNPGTVRITTLLDPTGASSIEPGPKDITADEGADDDEPGKLGGYIWDAALRAGKTVRHYGAYADENYYIKGSPVFLPIVRNAWKTKTLQSVPLRPALIGHTDPYYRGWDLNTPDEYRFEEWKREFDGFVAKGSMPDLEIMSLNMDHFGNFATNVAKLNTPPLQIASNDHALGELVDAVSHSPFWQDTAIFVLEDDAQDGPDHVDAHRTVAQVISPYVRAGAVVHTRYDTTSMVRTIEDILGIGPLGLNDANAAPMSDVFTTTPDLKGYAVIVPGLLCKPPVDPGLVPGCSVAGAKVTQATALVHDGAWWAAATAGMDFSRPDRVDSVAFNALLAEDEKK